MDGLSGLFLPGQQKAVPGVGGNDVLNIPDLAHVSRDLQNAMRGVGNVEGVGKTILVLDQLDLLLAAGGDHIGAVDLGDMLMGLREVHSQEVLHWGNRC